jgi:hypothetical protein
MMVARNQHGPPSVLICVLRDSCWLAAAAAAAVPETASSGASSEGHSQQQGQQPAVWLHGQAD